MEQLSPWLDAAGARPDPSLADWILVSLTLGIVGLPNVGKSTMFNALTRNDVLAANYPFATIEPNVGVVPLPDPRLDTARRDVLLGEGRPGDGVVRRHRRHRRRAPARAPGWATSSSPTSARPTRSARSCASSPTTTSCTSTAASTRLADIETIETELVLADLQTLEKALPRLEKEARVKKETKAGRRGGPARAERAERGPDPVLAPALDSPRLRELNLLTAKPFLYVFNADEPVLVDDAKRKELAELVAPADAVFLDAKVEQELLELDAESAQELLESIGQPEPGLDALARAGFHTLGLQTYLTAGPKESRAWTIPIGATAPQAAGVIHTDFERGFIKAEIVSYDDLVAAGSMAAAKTAGKVRMEGKDYVMHDGDVVEFRFNV